MLEAGHPLPDEAGREAAERILRLAASLGGDDLLLTLLSGGGSSLLTLPAPGVALAEKRALSAGLLRCGATIAEVDTVRKHLSRIKGGRLAVAAHPARVVTMLVSDVPGDDPSVVASGPTVADATTTADALEVLEKFRLTSPDAIVRHLRIGRRRVAEAR